MFSLFKKKDTDFIKTEMDTVLKLIKKRKVDEAKIHAAAIIAAIIQDYYDAYMTRWSKIQYEVTKIKEYESLAIALLEKGEENLTAADTYEISKACYMFENFSSKTVLSTFLFCQSLVAASDGLEEMFSYIGVEFTPNKWIEIIYPDGWTIEGNTPKEVMKKKVAYNKQIVDIVSRYNENSELIEEEYNEKTGKYELVYNINRCSGFMIETNHPRLSHFIHPATVESIIKNFDTIREAADPDTLRDPERQWEIYNTTGVLCYVERIEGMEGKIIIPDFLRKYIRYYALMPQAIVKIDEIYRERSKTGHCAGYESSSYVICKEILENLLGCEYKFPFENIERKEGIKKLP